MSSSSQAAPQKKSKGRQKVKIEKMENESNLQVTFSKRRAGLFKKASELCTLCGAEVAVIVFSPGKKVYAFGHPSLENIVNRFNGDAPGPTNRGVNEMIMEAHRNSNIRGLNLELTQLENRLAMEKKQAEELDHVKKMGRVQKWYPPAIEEFSYEQLDVFMRTILNFQKHFDEETKNAMMLAGGSSSNPVSVGNDGKAPALGFSFSDANVPFNSHAFNSFPTGFGDTFGLYPTGGMSVANSFGAYQAPTDPMIPVPPGVVDPAGEPIRSKFFVDGSSSVGASMLPSLDFMAPASSGLGPYGGFNNGSGSSTGPSMLPSDDLMAPGSSGLGPYGGFTGGSDSGHL